MDCQKLEKRYGLLSRMVGVWHERVEAIGSTNTIRNRERLQSLGTALRCAIWHLA